MHTRTRTHCQPVDRLFGLVHISRLKPRTDVSMNEIVELNALSVCIWMCVCVRACGLCSCVCVDFKIHIRDGT